MIQYYFQWIGTIIMPEIDMQINFRSKKTISEQLIDELLWLIEQGKLEAGAQLPPVRDLASQLQVHFNTVARAYRQLDLLGFISTQQGRGTYVLKRIPEQLPPFSEEMFLIDLDSFFQAEARRSGRTVGSLWEIVMKHRNLVRVPGRPTAAYKRKKVSHRPGWKPGKMASYSQKKTRLSRINHKKK